MSNLRAEAILKHQQGDFDAAKIAYLDYLAERPDDGDACDRLGVLFVQCGDLVAAKKYFNQAIAVGFLNATVYNHLGNVCKQCKEFDAAIAAFEQALIYDAQHAPSFNNLANTYFMLGEIDQAKIYYEKAIALEPNYVDAMVNLAICFLKHGDHNSAEIYLNKAYQRDAKHRKVCLLLGNISLEKNDFKSARDYYEKAKGTSVINPDLLNNLAACYIHLGDHAAAERCFLALLQVYPDNLIARSNLAHLYFSENALTHAITHYNLLLTDETYRNVSHFNLGIIYMRLRKWESALSHFDEVLKTTPNDAKAHINYATIHLKLGNEALAIQHYKKSLEIEPDNAIANYRLAALVKHEVPQVAPQAYVAQLFDDYAQHFDLDLMEKLNYRLPDTIYQAAEFYLPKQRLINMIDLGCGTGLSARLFTKHAQHLIGIDVSEKMLNLAEKKGYYDRLLCCDLILGLQKIDMLANLIIAADVFVYLGDLNAIFLAVKQKLEQDGLFIFTVEQGFDADYFLQKTGRYRHCKDYIYQLVDRYGFKVLDEQLISLRKQQGNEVLGYLFVLMPESTNL